MRITKPIPGKECFNMKKRKKATGEVLTYNLMMLPVMVLIIIFSIIPLLGLVIAFQNYIPAKGILGSPWVGFDNFSYMFIMPDSWQVLSNTIVMALGKMVMGIIVPVLFALMLNEIKARKYKRVVQTVVYMPYFLSWVILASVFTNLLSLDGVLNAVVKAFGGEPIMFLGSNTWFQPTMIITDVWKNFGYGAIIYLAALTSIDASLYEAASIDGASHMKQIWHITLPAIIPTVVLMGTLSLGNILNAGFDQIFNLYNPAVYKTADIIDTYVYRMGLVDLQFSLGTAVGMMKSVVSFVLITISYYLAGRFAGYRIF